MKSTGNHQTHGALLPNGGNGGGSQKKLGVHLPSIEKSYPFQSVASRTAKLAAVAAAAQEGSKNSLLAALENSGSSGASRSSMLGLEVRLKEVFDKYPQAPATERSYISFQIFGITLHLPAGTPATVGVDEILAAMEMLVVNAPYVATLRTIRDELYRSVYSTDLTTTALSPNSLDHVPFFKHVQRMTDNRQVELKDLVETVVDRDQKIKLRERDLSLLVKKNLNLKQSVTTMEAAVRHSKEEAETLREFVAKVESQTKDREVQHEKELEGMREKVERLQRNLNMATATVEKLSKIKNKDGDRSRSGEDMIDGELAKKHIVYNPLTLLRQHYLEAESLQQQMKEILITHLDDFEQSMVQLKKKREILRDTTVTNQTTTQRFNAEIVETVSAFQKRIDAFRKEQFELEKQMATLKATIRKQKTIKLNEAMYRWSDLSTRQYAATLSYSTNGGKTFFPYEEIPKCRKCGDATLLCTHQMFNSIDIPLRNPANSLRNQPWTHIRLENPELKMALTSGKIRLFEQQGYHEAVTNLEDVAVDSDQEDEDGGEPEEYLDTRISVPMRAIWRNFYRRYQGIKSRTRRVLTAEKLLWMVNEIYEVRYRMEEIVLEGIEANLYDAKSNRAIFHNFVIGETEDGKVMLTKLGESEVDMSLVENVDPLNPNAGPNMIVLEKQIDTASIEYLRDWKGFKYSSNFAEFVYRFLEHRYHFTDITMSVAHDFLTSLQVYEADHRILKMFVNTMSGRDEIGWKYVQLAKEIYGKVDNLTMERLRRVLSMMYPYRQNPEIYEQMELEEISFSKNRISADNCIEHLRYMLLTGTEPNYNAFYRNLKKFDHRKQDSFTMDDFLEFMKAIYPPAPTLLKIARFEIAKVNITNIVEGRVPIERLAMIGSYCLLWCTKHWGNWTSVPPYNIHGDRYVGKSPQEKLEIVIYPSDFSKRQFTSQQNLNEEDTVPTILPNGKPRSGSHRRRSSVLPATEEQDPELLEKKNAFKTKQKVLAPPDASSESAKLDENGNPIRELSTVERMEQAVLAETGHRIKEAGRDIQKDTETVVQTMEHSNIDYQDLPPVKIVADEPDEILADMRISQANKE